MVWAEENFSSIYPNRSEENNEGNKSNSQSPNR
jgi:hypothetical protein